MIYSGNVPNRGSDISNLCRHEPVAMVNGEFYRPKNLFKPVCVIMVGF